MILRRLLFLSLLACSSISAARWDSVYFHDHATEILEFSDIATPSAQRVIAIGTIRDTMREKMRHVAVVTSDSGDHWQEVKLDDAPQSLFFLNDTTGWMVTQRGIWKTDEAGRSWSRLSRHSPNDILRLWFLDENHGFGVGAKKNVVETKDGGRTWKKVAIAKDSSGDPKLSVYTHILFVDSQTGLILGTDLSVFSSYLRAWRSKTAMLQLKTNDGGLTWSPEPGPRGTVANSIKFSGEEVLILLGVADSRGNDSTNVYRIPLRKGLPASVIYEGKDVEVTDLGSFPGRAVLAGVDKAKSKDLESVERKVRILESAGPGDLWNEMEVDYAAQATKLVLAGTDQDHVFVATDRGMILRLKR